MSCHQEESIYCLDKLLNEKTKECSACSVYYSKLELQSQTEAERKISSDQIAKDSTKKQKYDECMAKYATVGIKTNGTTTSDTTNDTTTANTTMSSSFKFSTTAFIVGCLVGF